MNQTSVLNSYQATFILDTRGYEEPVETLIEKIRSTLASVGAVEIQTRDLGQKEFARVTNRKFPQALYVQFLFEAPAEVPGSLQEKFRLDRTVYRILVEAL